MNTQILLNLFFVFLLASCSKDAEIVNEFDREITNASYVQTASKTMVCDLEGAMIVPFCSADPIDFPKTSFPISVILNGERIFHVGYSYEWSTGSNGSAISISYNELPVSLILTDDPTGCQATLILDQSYWGKVADGGVIPVGNNDLPTWMLLPEGAKDGDIEEENGQGL